MFPAFTEPPEVGNKNFKNAEILSNIFHGLFNFLKMNFKHFSGTLKV